MTILLKLLILLIISGVHTVNSTKKILVLGGTGFVGSRFISQASQLNYQVYSLSRRGNVQSVDDSTSTSSNKKARSSPIWIAGDATDKATISMIINQYGPFDAYVHCIGLLFDSQSGLGSINKYASGSSSIPGPTSTYDDITRRTAFNLIEAVESTVSTKGSSKGSSVSSDSNTCTDVPIVFVSAAEAAWTFKAPVEFLERYLVAKRAVEKRLLLDHSNSIIRGIVIRPSLIWTWQRPQALLTVVPFYIGSTIGLPFIDRPVQIESLIHAMIVAIQDPKQRGIKDFKAIDQLASIPTKSLQ